ncbi:LacI family DNA-binding transcriptional regulator [Bacillus sp. JCM 19034]|uniref:LacI family DNA-binding transcriptional regulator n=1 Tax=Bacillus sp. JCM 19034 TaxID=1481928 RepID=UPI0009E9EC6E|nr:substrate-binding domain-containing protein [Bacillus sp. JCM 19034]
MGGRINEVEVNPSYVTEMAQVMERIPVLFVNGEMEGIDAHMIRTDEGDGIAKLVDMYTNLGHCHIGFLGGVRGITSTELKMETYKEELQKHGLDVVEEWIIPSNFTIESGEEAAQQLMKLETKPTAVICVNDFVAIGAINTFKKYGLTVPNDVAVSGFDDIYLAKYFPPGLTTISQNYDQLGEKAIKLLVDLMDGKDVPKETIIPTSLVIRESCHFS